MVYEGLTLLVAACLIGSLDANPSKVDQNGAKVEVQGGTNKRNALLIQALYRAPAPLAFQNCYMQRILLW